MSGDADDLQVVIDAVSKICNEIANEDNHMHPEPLRRGLASATNRLNESFMAAEQAHRSSHHLTGTKHAQNVSVSSRNRYNKVAMLIRFVAYAIL